MQLNLCINSGGNVIYILALDILLVVWQSVKYGLSWEILGCTASWTFPVTSHCHCYKEILEQVWLSKVVLIKRAVSSGFRKSEILKVDCNLERAQNIQNPSLHSIFLRILSLGNITARSLSWQRKSVWFLVKSKMLLKVDCSW